MQFVFRAIQLLFALPRSKHVPRAKIDDLRAKSGNLSDKKAVKLKV